MKKTLAIILAVLLLISCVSIAASAADEITPRYNNTNTVSIGLSINSSGLATAKLNCTGKSGVTTKIVAETKLQRKIGLIWFDVSGAEWTDTSTTYYMSKSHTFQLSNTGTYRAKTTYTVSGSGGSNDEITVTSQDVY